MKPTDTLKHEHQIVLAVLSGTEQEAARIKATGEVDTEKISEILEFFRVFVDQCHHAKEERLLFPRLEERGMSADVGPIAVMLHEHDLGRSEIAAISSALDEVKNGNNAAAPDLAGHLLAYCDLLRDHIQKEDSVLFEFADERLTVDDQIELSDGFNRLEMEEIGEGVHEQFHEFAHEILKG